MTPKHTTKHHMARMSNNVKPSPLNCERVILFYTQSTPLAPQTLSNSIVQMTLCDKFMTFYGVMLCHPVMVGDPWG